MSYFDDTKALLEYATESLGRIKEAYDRSLREEKVKQSLLIEIKGFMENLRSALDYSAHGIFEKYVRKRGKQRIYFPYALEGQNRADFRKVNRVEACVPGVLSARPDFQASIESYQHFTDPKNVWLPRFMQLNNENKHQALTPQIRKERKELRISSGGATIGIGEGASISVGQGASIKVGGLTIPGGQTISSEHPPITIGDGTTEIITWVAFEFSSNGEMVLPFLEQALQGVSGIVEDLSEF